MKRAFLLTLALGAAAGTPGVAQAPTDVDKLVQRGGLYLHPETLEPFSGTVMSTWSPGIVKEQGTLINGLWDGEHEWYHINGQLATRETWSNGQLNGPSQSYFRHGGPSVIENYEGGRLHGLYEAYWAYRGLAERGRWVAGEQCGEWLSFGRTIDYPACRD